MFLLGLGDKVVGVTRYCSYPPEAKSKSEVGGYLDPNYEAIISLNPDIVILLPEHHEVKAYLTKVGIKYLEVNNKTIDGIINCIQSIGKICGVTKKSTEIVNNMKSQIDIIKSKTLDLPRKSVLVTVGRDYGSGSIKDAYVAGIPTHYNEIINIAGGKNASSNPNLNYPMLSAEGILHLEPEVVIDIVPSTSIKGISKVALLKDWTSITNIIPLKQNNIYVYTKDYSSIPGPRIIYILQDFAKIIHPEADWIF